MDDPQQSRLAEPVGALGFLGVRVGVGEHDVHALREAHRPECRKIGPDAFDHRLGSEPASTRRTPFSIIITRPAKRIVRAFAKRSKVRTRASCLTRSQSTETVSLWRSAASRKIGRASWRERVCQYV